MSLARRIIRGTFRLSIVAAVLAAGWGFAEGYYEHSKERERIFERDMRQRVGYECAARQKDSDLLALQNTFQIIDVSKLHCTTEPFFVRMKEVREVRSQGIDAFLGPRREPYATQFDFGRAAVYAIAWAIYVNLLGFAVVGIIYVSRWVYSGFSTKS